MKILIALSVAFGATSAFAETTPISQLQLGDTVTISGTVQRITDEDEFRLVDSTGSVLVYIGPNIVPFDVGESLTVNGIVDREMGQMEIYARSAKRADGKKVVFDHRYD